MDIFFSVFLTSVLILFSYGIVKIKLTSIAASRAIEYVYDQPNWMELNRKYLDIGAIYSYKRIFDPRLWTYKQMFHGLEEDK